MSSKKFSRRQFVKTAGAGASLAAMSGCLGGSGGGEGPVRIGVLSPLHGGWTIFGEAHRRGIEVAVEMINEEGGINGREVITFVESTRTDAKVAAQKAEQLISRDDVDVLTGTYPANTRNAVGPVIQKHDIPFLFPTLHEGQFQENHPAQCNDLAFHFGPTPSQMATPWIDQLMDYGKNWYFVGSDYSWPRHVTNKMKQVLKENGGTVVGEEFVPLSATNLGPTVSRIVEKDPDLIFGSITSGQSVNFSQNMENRGIREDYPYFTVANVEFLWDAIGPEASEGSLVGFDYFYGMETEENERFLNKLHEMYPDLDPKTGMMTDGESMYLIGKAYGKAANQQGSVETGDIISGLEGLTFTGPQGEIEMREKDHQAILPSYLLEVNDFTNFADMYTVIDSKERVVPWEGQCEYPLKR